LNILGSVETDSGVTKIWTEIMENQGGDVRTLVAHASVTDADAGSNGRVTCSVAQDKRFSLEKMFSGQFKLMTSFRFDRETEELSRVTVECHDDGEPSLTSSALIHVSIGDENDNSPRFRQEFYSSTIKVN